MNIYFLNASRDFKYSFEKALGSIPKKFTNLNYKATNKKLLQGGFQNLLLQLQECLFLKLLKILKPLFSEIFLYFSNFL